MCSETVTTKTEQHKVSYYVARHPDDKTAQGALRVTRWHTCSIDHCSICAFSHCQLKQDFSVYSEPGYCLVEAAGNAHVSMRSSVSLTVLFQPSTTPHHQYPPLSIAMCSFV